MLCWKALFLLPVTTFGTYIGAGILCKSEIVPEISYGDKGEVASAEESGGEKVPEKVLTDKSNEEEEVLEKPPQSQEQN
jgi:hypothetical protein